MSSLAAGRVGPQAEVALGDGVAMAAVGGGHHVGRPECRADPDLSAAVGESSVTLLHPPLTSVAVSNSDVKGVSAEWQSRRWLPPTAMASSPRYRCSGPAMPPAKYLVGAGRC